MFACVVDIVGSGMLVHLRIQWSFVNVKMILLLQPFKVIGIGDVSFYVFFFPRIFMRGSPL